MSDNSSKSLGQKFWESMELEATDELVSWYELSFESRNRLEVTAKIIKDAEDCLDKLDKKDISGMTEGEKYYSEMPATDFEGKPVAEKLLWDALSAAWKKTFEAAAIGRLTKDKRSPGQQRYDNFRFEADTFNATPPKAWSELSLKEKVSWEVKAFEEVIGKLE